MSEKGMISDLHEEWTTYFAERMRDDVAYCRMAEENPKMRAHIELEQKQFFSDLLRFKEHHKAELDNLDQRLKQSDWS